MGRDPDSFWEQYKYDDPRHAEMGLFIGPTQDFRFLIRNTGLSTAAVTETFSVPPFDPDHPCVSGLIFPDSPLFFGTNLYRKNFSSPIEVTAGDMPQFYITSDKLLDNPVAPVIEETGEGGGPPFGVIYAITNYQMPAPWDVFPSPVAVPKAPGNVGADWWTDADIYDCDEDPPSPDYEQEYFCVMRSSSTNAATTDTMSWRDIAITKEAPIGRQTVDFSIDPAPGPGNTVDRYFQAWPTFQITDVRVVGGGVSQPV